MRSIEVVLKTIELIQQMQDRLQVTQSRQKSYGDLRRLDLEFQVGNFVLLKVSPWKGVIWLRKWAKLGPQFISPFRITARMDKVAYRLDFSDRLIQIHNTFHVS